VKASLRIRVDFEEGTILSPGKVRLLELVEDLGSVEQAATTIQMDHDHARHVIERLELLFGGPLIATEQVAPNASRSRLTELCKRVVERYHVAERISADAAQRALGDLVSLAPDRAPPLS